MYFIQIHGQKPDIRNKQKIKLKMKYYNLNSKLPM